MQIYLPGTRIGSYEIASRPMIGGMGVVYICLDHDNDRPVALKTFKPEFLPDRAARDRFLREGTAWVELGHHPHIVRCYEVKYIDPTAFLALELIAKEQGMEDASLRPWLGQPMPLQQALLFALQIARGLAYASTRIPGFVHRDLKPENVLVGADKLPGTTINRLRVTDFGLVAIMEGGGDAPGKANPNPRSTQLTHGVAGTPLYMAPEQWQKQALGAYTDIYALGCILFEMLTGRFAASGDNQAELQAAHCSGHLNPLPADLPRALRDLLSRALALHPAERYPTWAEMIRALEAAYAALGAGPVPEVEVLQAESLEEHQQAGWSYNEMGRAYLDLGKAEVAAGYFEKALRLARETGSRMGEGAALGNLGLAYAALGDARRAIGYYEQQIEITREIGDRRGEGNALNNIGEAYRNLGDARRAIGYYEQSLIIKREIGDRRGEGNALGNLGNVYLNLGDARRAIGYYEQAIEIQREIGDLSGVATSSFNMAVLYSQQGDPARALPLAREAAQAFARIGHPEYTRRAQELVVELGGGEAPPPDPAQAAFEAFQRADSPQAMQAAVAQHALLQDAGLIEAIEQAIADQVPPEQKPAFEQRLAWLKAIG